MKDLQTVWKSASVRDFFRLLTDLFFFFSSKLSSFEMAKDNVRFTEIGLENTGFRHSQNSFS